MTKYEYYITYLQPIFYETKNETLKYHNIEFKEQLATDEIWERYTRKLIIKLVGADNLINILKREKPENNRYLEWYKWVMKKEKEESKK